ncbi:unnamed protein product [Rotaria magnacalcarata]|nr:unnamed protein product [Rotaria magnacalcarata]
MPAMKPDPYATQISTNVFKFTNVCPIPFDVKSTFQSFNQPALIRFFEQHKNLGLDAVPFLFAMLVHVAVMLDGTELYNPDGTGFFTSMNLFVHLIGEPGTNKSGLFKVFQSSMLVLKKIFPIFFCKPIVENINGKEKLATVDLMVNNDTELSPFQRLSRRVSHRCSVNHSIFSKETSSVCLCEMKDELKLYSNLLRQ